MEKLLLFVMSLFASVLLEAQDMIQGYIINIENNKVCLDITAPKVKIGDVFSIHEEAGYMVHPVTKKRIKKEGAILADLEIVEVHKEYSIATVYPEEVIEKIKVGMIAVMPELPQGYTDSVLNSLEMQYKIENEVQSVTLMDANSIVQRYLKTTALEKINMSNYISPYYFKSSYSNITTKDKIYTSRNFYACDFSAKKIHMAQITSKKNRNFVLAINGDEGWMGFGNGMVIKQKESTIRKIWDEFNDKSALDWDVFNTDKWKRMLGGKRTIRGKLCTGVVFISKGQEQKKNTFYFDDATGLIVYGEREGLQTEFLEYQTFGEFVLCSKKRIVYLGKAAMKSKLKESTVILQEISFDCSLDNSLFTKEGVKQAFK